jgi:hypothetical protein
LAWPRYRHHTQRKIHHHRRKDRRTYPVTLGVGDAKADDADRVAVAAEKREAAKVEVVEARAVAVVEARAAVVVAAPAADDVAEAAEDAGDVVAVASAAVRPDIHMRAGSDSLAPVAEES